MDLAKLSDLQKHLKETSIAGETASEVRRQLSMGDIKGAFRCFVDGFEQKAK